MVLADLFPEPVESLRAELEAAAKRGCQVFVQVYQPTTFSKSIRVFLKEDHERQRSTWPGQWLNLVGDAQEHLLVLLRASDGGVHRALWTESKYLSVLYHAGIKHEMAFSFLASVIQSGASQAEIQKEYEKLRKLVNNMDLPGYVALLDQFGAAPRPSKSSRR